MPGIKTRYIQAFDILSDQVFTALCNANLGCCNAVPCLDWLTSHDRPDGVCSMWLRSLSFQGRCMMQGKLVLHSSGSIAKPLLPADEGVAEAA